MLTSLRSAACGAFLVACLAAPTTALGTPRGVPGPIVFAGFDDAGGSISSVDPAGGPITKVSNGPLDADLAALRPGGPVVFARAGDLWLAGGLSGAPVNLTSTPDVDERNPAFAANGQSLAFVARTQGFPDTYELVVAAFGPGGVLGTRELLDLQLSPLAHPSFSPDSARVAYDRVVGVGAAARPQVHVVDRATQTSTAAGPADSSDPDWSPSGDALAIVVTDNGQARIDVGPLGGPWERLAVPARQPTFSPAGDAIAATTADGGTKIDLLGRGADMRWATADDTRRTLTGALGYGESAPSWTTLGDLGEPLPTPVTPPAAGTPVRSPGPRFPGRLFYSTSDDDPAGEIYSQTPSGGAPVRLTRREGYDRDPDVSSPDGDVPQRVAFTRGEGRLREIWTMRPDGSQPSRFQMLLAPEFASDPSWAPDGRTVAFTGRSGESRTSIYVATEGAAARRLTTRPAQRSDPVQDSAPAVSPDGRKVAFRRVGADFVPLVCVIDIDGTRERCSVSRLQLAGDVDEQAARRRCEPEARAFCSDLLSGLTPLAARGVPAWDGNEILMTAGESGNRRPLIQNAIPYGVYADDDQVSRSLRTNVRPSLEPVFVERALAPLAVVPAPTGNLAIATGQQGDSGDILIGFSRDGRSVWNASGVLEGLSLVAWQAVSTPMPEASPPILPTNPQVRVGALRVRGGTLRGTLRNEEAFGVEIRVRISGPSATRAAAASRCAGRTRLKLFLAGGERRRVRIPQVRASSRLCLTIRAGRGNAAATAPVTVR
ncbi:MAG: PD40 domain-containing protein [Solirubrobacteraceae bacterium]|nr:PD40 domain-containing protein [Solirubrobacteraceae bacterium]